MANVSQDRSPVDIVKAFIACIKTKDLEQMHKMTHPTATACLIRDNEPRFSALSEAINALEKTVGEFVEVSWDEVEHKDGVYATVWASFSMQRDGKLHQLGSSSYSLWKSSASGWMILSMSDIARSPGDAVRK